MWTNAGGDFVAAANAATSVGGLGKYEWSSDQMNADVQAWLGDAATNFGWILIGNESKVKTANRFDSMVRVGQADSDHRVHALAD